MTSEILLLAEYQRGLRQLPPLSSLRYREGFPESRICGVREEAMPTTQPAPVLRHRGLEM